ncbi:TfoX/Sxy family protein [Dongia rigui]|uniref:TfoX/Sxy family protein n=1 Tax=Dongia rigui TaxID=940149 RepID=A0ABU5DU00_9PROT|nr:TfoX/Sxy family protein [Dongia rigui]MDY0870801.1 TfoX/Sxy family protein [Dongia rigui]
MASPLAKELVAVLEAKLAPLGPTLGPMRAKPMFSGYGLYLDGIIFGLVLRETFYLKVDDENRPDFVKAGSVPFRYATRQKEVTVDSYWICPEKVFKDAAKLRAWVEKSLAASRRANARKKPRSTKPRPRRNPLL